LAAPGSEGSGLIDIRALGAMVGTQSTTAARSDGTNSGATDGAPLPSFAGSSLGLAATPLAPNPTMMDPAALAAAATPRSNPLLYLVVGALVVAVVALGYMLFMRDQQRELEAKNSASMAPSVIAAAKDDEADEDESEDKKKDKDDEDALEVDEFEEIEEADPVTGKKVKRRVKKTTQRRKPSDSDPLKDAAKDPAPKAPTKTASKGEDVSVGCILDPDSCKDKASGSSKPKTAAVDPNLPPSLTAAEFKKGLQSVKSQAKSCGSRHGAKGGDSVQIRLSISGSTGNVTSAAATGPHKGTALGNCVAAAIKSAKFSKFQKSSQGFSFGVRM
jgi:cell division protein FtsN